MGSGREKQVTRFLNVDLDMGGSTDDLERCLRAIEDSVVVLNRGYREVSLELADEFASLEETMMGFVAVIGALDMEAGKVWKSLEFRRLKVGIQAADAPYAAGFVLSRETVALLAAHQFEVVFTVYAPLAD
jgi:hypothetical protein